MTHISGSCCDFKSMADTRQFNSPLLLLLFCAGNRSALFGTKLPILVNLAILVHLHRLNRLHHLHYLDHLHHLNQLHHLNHLRLLHNFTKRNGPSGQAVQAVQVVHMVQVVLGQACKICVSIFRPLEKVRLARLTRTFLVGYRTSFPLSPYY